MDFDQIFRSQLDTLKAEGNYRTFAELDRKRGSFPRADNHKDGKVAEVTVWCSNDYLGMGQHPDVVNAMVDAVPAGQYGKQSLEALGLWAVAEPLVAQSENVRAALALAATGEAPYGIVYASDAVAGDNVTVVGQFPETSHAPITYPAALLTGAADAADRAFFDALSADAADAKFAAQGFNGRRATHDDGAASRQQAIACTRAADDFSTCRKVRAGYDVE